MAALVVVILALALVVPGASSASAPDGNPWTAASSVAGLSSRQADIRTNHFAGFSLNRDLMKAGLDRAPQATGLAPAAVIIPTPAGDFQRFAMVDAPVMEPGLAAAHPEIRTFAGKGIDDPTATVRADLTPLGFHASVRSAKGSWFVDPYFHADQSLYASYYGHDLASPGPLVEPEDIDELIQDLPPALTEPVVKLRTYRLALVTDPSYATFFGAENVTAAKVTLINRVAQIYEDETAIRLLLINDTDKTNLNTPEQANLPNGPCGAAACYTPAQLAGCAGSTLNRNNIVLGQLVGASNYDVGHIGLGVNGGGVAGLGVVGGATKARGCTGLPTPVGDFYAVDYVAHEVGHQFGGNHTFNGTQLNCSGGNRNGSTSVEPGSGSSIMAYAGICQQDNLQPHSDPYWSERSYTEITNYTSSLRPLLNEVQNVSLRAFDTDGDSFAFMFGGQLSAPVVRGTNYTTAGIKAAIEGTRNWPAGATVTVAGFGGAAALDDTGFQVTFNGGPIAGTNVDSLGIANAIGTSAFVGETVKGGPQDNGGVRVTDTTNHAPVVNVPAAYTIPARTPFTLSGSATDSDGDALAYMWEQNDRGSTGTALVNNTKVDGPLFRQFGTAAVVSASDTLKYYSPGENTVNADSTRTFPDLTQILANNTNAATGACPAAPPAPTVVPATTLDCFSEFLPTRDWVGQDGSRTMHFRLTARDGRLGGGGIGFADTAVSVAPDAGPFQVTSQGSAATLLGGRPQAVTWNVAGTDAAPIGASTVKISLSTDGGLTFPYLLAEATPNDGNEMLTMPDVASTTARIKVEAVGNVFFDLNDADLTIKASPRLANDAPAGIAGVQYSDALSPTVTVSANDPDTAGAALTATAAGLPAGLSLSDGGPGRQLASAALSGRGGSVDGNAVDGVGPGTHTWTVTGATTAAPGDYPVSVAVTDDVGLVSTTAFTVRVAPEDAELTYTGDAITSGRDGATVLLRATIRDGSVVSRGADSTAGDIRTGTVTFLADGRPLCSGPVGLLGTDGASASASCTATFPLGTRQVSVVAGGNYTGAATGTVDVQRAAVRTATAGVTLTENRSAGTFAADRGSRFDLALLAGHTGSSPTGLVTAIFTSGGKRYQIISSGIDSFGARISGRTGAVDLRGRATLVDITNLARPVLVGNGFTLRLSGNDDGLFTGGHDTLAVTLMDGEKLLFSSDWSGAGTTEIPLANGNLLVR